MTKNEKRLTETAHLCAGLAALFGIVGYVVEIRAVSAVAVGFAVAWIVARIRIGFIRVSEMSKEEQ
jgi:phage shock protein PspC (stress-responsive transcriptional regulator)